MKYKFDMVVDTRNSVFEIVQGHRIPQGGRERKREERDKRNRHRHRHLNNPASFTAHFQRKGL